MTSLKQSIYNQKFISIGPSQRSPQTSIVENSHIFLVDLIGFFVTNPQMSNERANEHACDSYDDHIYVSDELHAWYFTKEMSKIHSVY